MFSRRMFSSGKERLDGGKNCVVTAPGAPTHFLVSLEVFGGERGVDGWDPGEWVGLASDAPRRPQSARTLVLGYSSDATSWITEASSAALNGMPRTCV